MLHIITKHSDLITAKSIGSLFYLTHNELYLQYQFSFQVILASIHVNYATLINEYTLFIVT